MTSGLPPAGVRVFEDHQLVASYASDHFTQVGPQGRLDVYQHQIQADDTTRDVKVASFAAGTWHAAGEGIACGFVRPDPNCPNCHGMAP